MTSPAPSSRSRLSALPAKPDCAGLEQSVRLERELVALLGLFADRQQPHLGPRDIEDVLGEDDAHVSELEQVLRASVGVRAAVQEDERAATPRRDRNGDRRPHDAGDSPEMEQPRGQHRAGVAGGEDGVRPSLGDRDVGGDQRGARLCAHGLRRLLVHLDHVRRLDELEAVRVDSGRAEEDDLDPLCGSVQRARDDLVRRPVASHRVDRYAGQGYGAGVRSGSISRPLYVLHVGQT